MNINKRITIQDIANELEISKSSAQKIFATIKKKYKKPLVTAKMLDIYLYN